MIPDEGLKNILDLIKGANYPTLHLVKVDLNTIADKDMTLADLTGTGVEADYPGYSARNLDSFGSSSIVSPDDGLISEVERVFQPSGMVSSQTIYGYYVTFKNRGSGDVLWIWRRFTTPLVLLNDASQIKITVNVYDTDFSPP